MQTATIYDAIKKWLKTLDWKLLLFLLLFLNVKIAVKIVAIIIVYLLRTDFKFGFRLQNSRLPLFYPLIIIVACAGLFISKNYSAVHYPVVWLYGIGFWLLCLLAVHQVQLAIERNDAEVIHHTLKAFFVINIVLSLGNLLYIIWQSGAANPYTYQGEHQKYFLNTGDYIKGLTFDTSNTNAIINAFGVIYFLIRKNAAMVSGCMIILLLTASNFTNIILMVILALLFVFKSSRNEKSIIAICVMLLVVFMVKVSPQNNGYVSETFNNILHRPNPDKTIPSPAAIKSGKLSAEQQRITIAQHFIDSVNYAQSIQNGQKIKQTHFPDSMAITTNGRILIPEADINLEPYQSLVTTPADQLPLVAFTNQHKTELPLSGKPFKWSATPGKIVTAQQTIAFFKAYPTKLIMGDGMGNFSSKLAFRAASLNISGSYPASYTYIDHDFLTNHLDLYLNYFSQRAGYHSLLNSPFSVYDQLLSEYGIIGLLVFFGGYIWFFAKNIKALTYGVPLLLLTLAMLNIDYWFEQLSILVLFELLLLLDMKQTSAPVKLNYV